MEELYDEVFAVSRLLTSSAGTPATRIETMIIGLFEAMERHRKLFAAMLEARATSDAVREMWEADRQSFVEPLAELIQGERDAGRAPDGPEPVALATVLLELNDRALERVVRGGRAVPRPADPGGDGGLAAHHLRNGRRRTGRSMKYDEIEFDSQGTSCAAWHWTGVGDAFAHSGGRPVVVMAHGLAGTKDSGLAAVRRVPGRGRVSTCSPSTTAASVRAMAPRASGSAWPPSSRTTGRRWRRPPGCRASTGTASCCGASPSPAVTSSRRPPGAPTWRP